MPGRYFPGGQPPMLFTQGSADTINPPWMSLRLYRADAGSARYYLDLFGASHLSPYEGNESGGAPPGPGDGWPSSTGTCSGKLTRWRP